VPKSLSVPTFWALAAAAATTLLVGCSAEVSLSRTEPSVPKDEVANTAAEELAAQTGQPKPDITCPEDLTGKVGATLRCTLTGTDGVTIGVTVKVTSVDGDRVDFSAKVDDSVS
jgi:hypothetical protein